MEKSESVGEEVIEVGSQVMVKGSSGTSGRKGIVRFIGETQFAAGEWFGIELSTADGKNDGSISNVRYFTCPPNHGLFVKRSQVLLAKQKQSNIPGLGQHAKGEKEKVSEIDDKHPPSTPSLTTEKHDKLEALREKRRQREAQRVQEEDGGGGGNNIAPSTPAPAPKQAPEQPQKMSSTSSDAEAELSILNAKLTENENKVNILKQQNEKVLADVAAKDKLIKEKEDLLQELQERLSKAESEVQTLLHEKNNHDIANEENDQAKDSEEVSELHGKIQNLESTISNLQNEISNLQTKSSANVLEQSNEVKRLQSQLDALQGDIASKELTISQLTTNYEQSQQELVTSKSENASTLDKIKHLNETIASLEKNVAQENQVSSHLKVELEGTTAEINSLKSNIQSLNKASGAESATITILNEQLQEKDNSLASLKEKIAALENQITMLQTNSENERLSYEKTLAAKEEELLQSLNRCNELSDKISDNSSQQEDLQSLIKQLKSDVEGSDTKIAELQAENGKLAKIIEEKSNELVKATQNVENISSQHDKLMKTLFQKDEEINKLVTIQSSKEQQIAELTLTLNDLQTKNEKSADQKSGETSALNEKIEKLESQIVELQDTTELLTLECEQKGIELELSEENCKSLKEKIALLESHLESAHQVSTQQAETSGEVSLEEQNKKLIEALRRLQAIHTEDIKKLEELTKLREERDRLSNELEVKTAKLQDCLDEMEENKMEIQLLTEQVDETESYAALVENLSSKNQELSVLVTQLRTEVNDLEQAVELADELDSSQRQEIHDLRVELDSSVVKSKSLEAEKQKLLQVIDQLRFRNEKLNSLLETVKLDQSQLAETIEQVSTPFTSENERKLLQGLHTQYSRILILEHDKDALEGDYLELKSNTIKLQMLLYPMLQSADATSEFATFLKQLLGPNKSNNEFITLSQSLGMHGVESSVTPVVKSVDLNILNVESTIHRTLYSAVHFYHFLCRVIFERDSLIIDDSTEHDIGNLIRGLNYQSICATTVQVIVVCWTSLYFLAQNLFFDVSNAKWLFEDANNALHSYWNLVFDNERNGVLKFDHLEKSEKHLSDSVTKLVNMIRKQKESVDSITHPTLLENINAMNQASKFIEIDFLARRLHAAIDTVTIIDDNLLKSESRNEVNNYIDSILNQADKVKSFLSHGDKENSSLRWCVEEEAQMSTMLTSYGVLQNGLDAFVNEIVYGKTTLVDKSRLHAACQQWLNDETKDSFKNMTNSLAPIAFRLGEFNTTNQLHVVEGDISKYKSFAIPRILSSHAGWGYALSGQGVNLLTNSSKEQLSKKLASWVYWTQHLGNKLVHSLQLEGNIDKLNSSLVAKEKELQNKHGELSAATTRISELESLLRQSGSKESTKVAAAHSSQNKSLESLREENKTLMEALAVLEEKLAQSESQAKSAGPRAISPQKGSKGTNIVKLASAIENISNMDTNNEFGKIGGALASRLDQTNVLLISLIQQERNNSQQWRRLATSRLMKHLSLLHTTSGQGHSPAGVFNEPNERKKTAAKKIYREIRMEQAKVSFLNLEKLWSKCGSGDHTGKVASQCVETLSSARVNQRLTAFRSAKQLQEKLYNCIVEPQQQ